MGQTQSTPKALLLGHFTEVRRKALNLGLTVKKGKFDTLCSAEWLTFGVGWPPEGSFSLSLLSRVKEVITRPGSCGHPDQLPYVLTWEFLLKDPPKWLQPFIQETPILAPERTGEIKRRWPEY